MHQQLTMNRLLQLSAGFGLLAVGAVGGYQLMVWNTHFLLLAMWGAACSAAAGWLFAGWRGLLLGAGLGFVITLAYLPVWFLLDLPPHIDINL
jgi:hypothetical protein